MKKFKNCIAGLVASLVAIAAMATKATAGTVFDQGFETDTSGMLDSDDAWYGQVVRTASGGITAATGGYYGLVTGDNTSAPFTRFDMYRNTWPGTYTASVDVYLDTSWASGSGFDWSVASSAAGGGHRRDFVFHVAKDTSTSSLLVGGSNNSGFATIQNLEAGNHYVVGSTGWYTLESVFRDNGGSLAVDLNLRNSGGSLLWTETRNDLSDLIPSVVGGNRYGWFTFVDQQGGIAVDNVRLDVSTVPLPPAAWSGIGALGGLFGLAYLKRRKSSIFTS